MPVDFDLVPNALGQLVLKRPGVDDVTDVRPRQAFPWSAAGTMVSVRDNAGKELILIDRLADLPTDLRQRIETWMAANSFLPEIRTVNLVVNNFGFHTWDVVTDRGPAVFQMQEREDLRFLPGGRFSIKDTNGNIYLLPPVEDLDEASQRAVRVVL